MVSVVRVELPGPIVREPEVAKIPNIALKHTLVGSTCTASLEMNGLVEVRFGQNLERLLWNVPYSDFMHLHRRHILSLLVLKNPNFSKIDTPYCSMHGTISEKGTLFYDISRITLGTGKLISGYHTTRKRHSQTYVNDAC